MLMFKHSLTMGFEIAFLTFKVPIIITVADDIQLFFSEKIRLVEDNSPEMSSLIFSEKIHLAPRLHNFFHATIVGIFIFISRENFMLCCI